MASDRTQEQQAADANRPQPHTQAQATEHTPAQPAEEAGEQRTPQTHDAAAVDAAAAAAVDDPAAASSAPAAASPGSAAASEHPEAPAAAHTEPTTEPDAAPDPAAAPPAAASSASSPSPVLSAASSPPADSRPQSQSAQSRPSQRPEDLLAQRQADAAQAKVAEQARMAAQMAADARAEVQAKVALAQERKALLEAESQQRATARAQEHARLARLAEELKAQQARDRAQRLADIEAARADLAAAQAEEDARLKAQAISDAERRRREIVQRNAERIERERSRASKTRRPPPNPDSGSGESGSTPPRAALRLSTSTQRLSQEELDRIAPLDKRARIEEEGEDDELDHDDDEEEEGHSEDSVGKPRRTRAVRDAERALLDAARQRESSPKRLPPPPPAFDVVRNHSPQGILPHIFDLFTVADAPPISIDHALRDVLQASAAAAQPLTPGAVLPLTILFDCDSRPIATFHTDPHGCIRRNVWDALDARSVFVKFERNVALQRQAMAAATAVGGGSHGKLAIVAHPEEELAATLLVLDGSLPPLSLTLLDVGVLLKNGVGACRVIPRPYAATVEGFIVQNFVFPAIEKPASIAAHLTATKAPVHLPHYTLYRCDFSSASHFDVQRRTNRFTLWPPAGAEKSAGGIVSPHTRIVGFKCPGSDKLTTTVSIVSKGSDPHLQSDRDMVSQLRRVCVSLLKKVNEKCRSEEVVVQRLCLYFTAELGGAVHLLYGDRIDLRLQHQPAPAASAASSSSFAPSAEAVSSTSVSGLAGRARQIEQQQAPNGITRIRSTGTLAPIKQTGQQWQQ